MCCVIQWLEKCHRDLSTLTTNLREKEIYNQLSEKVHVQPMIESGVATPSPFYERVWLY